MIVVGAGISGIAAAHYLTVECPDHSFVVLDALPDFGGTWRTHRYPGVRSDSDLYTYGYAFKPWTRAPIATGDEILSYMEEVIRDDRLAPRIRYGHAIRSASWSSRSNRWTLVVERKVDGTTIELTTSYLWMCQGYYRQTGGYTPQWEGLDAFQGRLVHPQSWPEDLDCTGKRVVVIGSGATAATLIPAIAGRCDHVTMLQRSPTYFTIGRNAVALADELRELKVSEPWIHEIVRRKLLRERHDATERAKNEPEAFRRDLLDNVRAHLGGACPIDPHFSPTYLPWTQRIAFDPDGALFESIRKGQASVVTDRIRRFRADEIELESGRILPADIVVTATGFDLSVMGDIAFSVDGNPADFSRTVAFRGLALTGIPNLAWIFGYHRASWTLRVDLVAAFACRVTPELREEDRDMPLRPWIDPKDFNPGYMQRGVHLLPRQGTKPDWCITDDYLREKEEFEHIDLDDAIFRYVRVDSVAEV